jgi:hypothetical protein
METDVIKRLRSYVQIVLQAAAFIMLSTAASAQSFDRDSNEIILAPYLWATAISGTSTVGMLPPLDIDASFSDILDNLNFAMSLHTEFKRGPWVFVIDPTYISLEMEVVLPIPDVPAGKMEVDVWIIELWAGYQFHDNWEVIGGARYQDQDISISGLPDPPFTPPLGVSDDWTDWFAGLRFNADLGDKWLMVWRGDVVVAGDSDSSWNSSIFFNRRFGDNKMLNLGYRYLVDDYVNAGIYGWDVTQDGPVVGFTWAF